MPSKRTILLSLLTCGILLVQCAVAPPVIEDVPANDQHRAFPDKIFFRATNESFNGKYYFLVDAGRLFVKEHDDFKENLSDWILIRDFPIPKNAKETDAFRYDAIDQINVDGKKMQIVSGNKIYTCNLALSEPEDWVWDSRWGFPFAKGPGLALRPKHRGWSVSATSPGRQKYQTDQNGNKFSVFVGSIYLLSEDGASIHLADPWTPADWGYQIAGPSRGRFIARSISAGGSVVFLINDYGDMYTKYVDFDVIGANPTLRYTYDTIPIHKGIFNRQHPRKLPIADWERQPKIDGAISSKITIYTTGEGETARGLRVEGKDSQGKFGYYEKMLTDKNWSFIETPPDSNAPIQLIANTPERTDPPIQGQNKDFRYSGEFAGRQAVLDDFNLFCSPASLRISYKSGTYLQFYLHTVFSFRTNIQKHPGTSGSPLKLKGVIEIPEALAGNTDPETKDFLKEFLGYSDANDASRFIPIRAEATDTDIEIHQVGLLPIFSKLKMNLSRSSVRVL